MLWLELHLLFFLAETQENELKRPYLDANIQLCYAKLRS